MSLDTFVLGRRESPLVQNYFINFLAACSSICTNIMVMHLILIIKLILHNPSWSQLDHPSHGSSWQHPKTQYHKGNPSSFFSAILLSIHWLACLSLWEVKNVLKTMKSPWWRSFILEEPTTLLYFSILVRDFHSEVILIGIW